MPSAEICSHTDPNTVHTGRRAFGAVFIIFPLTPRGAGEPHENSMECSHQHCTALACLVCTISTAFCLSNHSSGFVHSFPATMLCCINTQIPFPAAHTPAACHDCFLLTHTLCFCCPQEQSVWLSTLQLYSSYHTVHNEITTSMNCNISIYLLSSSQAF